MSDSHKHHPGGVEAWYPTAYLRLNRDETVIAQAVDSHGNEITGYASAGHVAHIAKPRRADRLEQLWRSTHHREEWRPIEVVVTNEP